MNNKTGSAKDISSDELPPVGSSEDRKSFTPKGKADFTDEDFTKRYPRPKGKNDPRGPKIIIRKAIQPR
jgi:hypothetical protein